MPAAAVARLVLVEVVMEIPISLYYIVLLQALLRMLDRAVASCACGLI